MKVDTFSFRVGSAPASGRVYAATGARPAHATIVLAPGAGAPQTHPWLVAMAGVLAARGFDTVTFDFPYAEAGRRAPDRADVLEGAWRAAIAAVRSRGDLALARLYIGGKSMGGRIATQVAAAAGGAGDGVDLRGLVLLGYPLHPPGRPEKLRAAHLPRVPVPMLFVQGSRDTFGTPDELRPILAPLAARGTRLFVVDGGDHSLTLPKKAGIGLDAVLARVADEIVRFTA